MHRRNVSGTEVALNSPPMANGNAGRLFGDKFMAGPDSTLLFVRRYFKMHVVLSASLN
jgi:hypothetical protein